MPRTRKSTTRRRRKARPSRRKPGLTTVVSRTSPIPDRYMCKLKYSQNVQLATTGANPIYHLFRTNSLFDPDYTGVGHQPYGFDQLAILYTKYRVYGMKYKITCTNIAAVPVNVAVVLKPVNTPSTVWSTIAEKPYNQVRHLAPQGAGGSIKVINGYVQNHKLLGVSKQEYRIDDDFDASMGGNPTTVAYLHVYVEAPAGTAAHNVYVDVQLTYFASMFSRVPLAGS